MPKNKYYTTVNLRKSYIAPPSWQKSQLSPENNKFLAFFRA
jgi:hypothetical protein